MSKNTNKSEWEKALDILWEKHCIDGVGETSDRMYYEGFYAAGRELLSTERQKMMEKIEEKIKNCDIAIEEMKNGTAINFGSAGAGIQVSGCKKALEDLLSTLDTPQE